ncbi:cupin domain-containing protein [Nocardia sp. NPDC051570]|uniref:cupin domain-containing protein n=1 Tax=Nocardia sp. NPDC051570 TaxID=3364324 RepID=UPI0037B2C4B8
MNFDYEGGMALVSEVVISDLVEPSIVHGVHGADGVSQWKCFARRSDLHGDWEAIEWAALPPNGISGEHVHTRTEELYFIVSGAGIMIIDEREYPVRSGDLILNGLGTRHGLRNVGSETLTWIVIEVLGPTTAAMLSEYQQQFEC